MGPGSLGTAGRRIAVLVALVFTKERRGRQVADFGMVDDGLPSVIEVLGIDFFGIGTQFRIVHKRAINSLAGTRNAISPA